MSPELKIRMFRRGRSGAATTSPRSRQELGRAAGKHDGAERPQADREDAGGSRLSENGGSPKTALIASTRCGALCQRDACLQALEALAVRAVGVRDVAARRVDRELAGELAGRGEQHDRDRDGHARTGGEGEADQ